MKKYFEEFNNYLQKYDKENCIKYVHQLLKSNVKLQDIYENIIIKTLENIGLPDDFGNYDIATEHIYSSIIRSVIENCSLHIDENKDESNGNTVVVCGLEGELHEIGCRLVADYFSLYGYKVVFLGSNIPNDEIMETLEKINPNYIAISVTNYYHLMKLNRLIKSIKKDLKVKIIVGGQAVIKNYEYIKKTYNVDKIIISLNEIKNILGDTDENSI